MSAVELAKVTPLLLATGAGALAWNRIKDSRLDATAEAAPLRAAHRKHALQAAVHEQELMEVLAALGSSADHVVLVKGWAIARQYSSPGLRPFGDIDLCVRADHFSKVQQLLAGIECRIDLHKGFSRLGNTSWKELFTRTRNVPFRETSVRVLSEEDHLRLLCFHFLREGAWRPLWLCDVAVAVETRHEHFDWQKCLGESEKEREWVALTIALARELLGAKTEAAPPEASQQAMPKWVVPSVLKEWRTRSMQQRHRAPLSSAWRHPMRSLRTLRHHWPTPVEATIDLNGPFNEFPRLPLQLGNCVARTARFIWHLGN